MTNPNVPDASMPPDPFDSIDADAIEMSEIAELFAAVAAERLDSEECRGSTVLMAGESFALWLAEKFPEEYGGQKALDPVTAYALLKLLQIQE